MRILVVTQRFWPENFRINDLLLQLKKRGHEISVFTGLPNYPSGKIYPGWGPFKRLSEEWEGIRIIRFPHFPQGKGKRPGMIVNYLSFAILGSLFAPFRVKGRYDLIFVYEPSPVTVGLPAIVLKMLRKMPIVFWVQDLWPESFEMVSGFKNRFIIKAVRMLSSFIHRASDRILVTSKAFIQPIEKQGVAKEKISYYPQTAEGFYRPVNVGFSSIVKELPEGFRITFAGNVGVAQSVETIAKAASLTTHIPEIKWIVIGDGRNMDTIRGIVKRRNLSDTIFLLGRKKPEEMPKFFAHSDVLLLTLKKDPVFSMTIPAKLQSYMACKKPILAAVDGETGRLITQSNAGICVPAEDGMALAKAAETMFHADLEMRTTWGENAYRYFKQNFEPEKMIKILEKYLQEMLNHRSEGGN